MTTGTALVGNHGNQACPFDLTTLELETRAQIITPEE